VSLFEHGQLDESEQKFNEVLALDPEHDGARDYLDNRLALQRVQLQQRMDLALKVQEFRERGERLYAEEDYDGATAAWNQAAEMSKGLL